MIILYVPNQNVDILKFQAFTALLNSSVNICSVVKLHLKIVCNVTCKLWRTKIADINNQHSVLVEVYFMNNCSK